MCNFRTYCYVYTELTAADVNVDVLQGQNGEIKVEIHFEVE